MKNYLKAPFKTVLITAALGGLAIAVSGCTEINETRSDLEDTFASDAFMAVKQSCQAGDVQSCANLEQIRAAKRQANATNHMQPMNGYNANRNRDLTMQHGAGGCVPNYSTGGCL